MTNLTSPQHDIASILFDADLIARYDGHGPRYTSYPTADRFNPNFTEADYRGCLDSLAAQANNPLADPLSVYVHLPFCNTLCYYCACNKIITRNTSRADRYLDCLVQEIEMQAARLSQGRSTPLPICQLHFGGGTPTFLSCAQLERLMDAIRRQFHFLPESECAIEIDPRKVNKDTILFLAQQGFNRISIGVQDFNPIVQAATNRIQSEEETRYVIEAARENGFKSVNIDLIYGLPYQTPITFQETIERVIRIRPDRIALYNYAHLPTRFPSQQRIDSSTLPTPIEKIEILGSSIQQLCDAGYCYIGMDHFALPDDELTLAQCQGTLHRNFQGYSRHANCSTIAFGVSAISQLHHSYSQNTKNIEDYEQRIKEGRFPVDRGIQLNQDDLIRRAVIQALMCQFKLTFSTIEHTFQIDFHSYFATELARLTQHIQDQLVQVDDRHITILPAGRLLVRSIAIVFDKYHACRENPVSFSRLI